MPNYPATLDNSASLPKAVDNLTPIQAATFNRLRDAIIAIEQELGIKPSNLYSTVRARLDALEAIATGDINFSGDLSGTLASQTVIGIQSRSVATTAPADGQALVWDSGLNMWTPKDVQGGGPSFGIASFGGAGGLVEVGYTSTNPAFTASYTAGPPTSATLSDSDGGSQSLVSPYTSFSSNYSFTKNTFGASVTFTLTAYKNVASATSNRSLVWCQKNFYGVDTAGQTGEAFIESLTSFLSTSRNATFTVNADTGESIYYSCRNAYGTPTFTVGGFEGGFSLKQTVTVTNTYGFSESYDLYESDNTGLGSTTIVVT